MINNITYYGSIPEEFYSFAVGLTDLQKAEIRESFILNVQVSRRYCVFYARDFYFLIYASGEIELMRPGFTKVAVSDLLEQGRETFRVCARPGTVDVSLSYLDVLEVQSNFDSQLILDNLVLVLDELKKKLASLALLDSTESSTRASADAVIQSAVDAVMDLVGLVNNALDSEVVARGSADSAEVTARNSAIAVETT
ncbi:MAG: hypothetical protein JJE17_07355, partial [Peptostreptococcaceae bacterium]|nr:hypothetical protein [Peptostreptococcaceae bacterium]